MIFYHHGAAVQPSAVRVGNGFAARALIQSKEGETDSLLDLGLFVNRSAAMQFAIRSALAYVEGKPMPTPPVKVFNGEDAPP
ncbi:hypothetical protein [Caballeronia zhejiangensis]|uniref:hypothetical protein n=1 Tax=Caballeronia zhejiangensis TaxID=871203 RepID=UPI001FD28B86|nr:hypothetical protein [Caballeronia zhejiangensis]